MKKLLKLKETENAFQRSLTAMNREISKQRVNLLSLEEIYQDLQIKLNELQRDIILRFKGLSDDEALAIRTGLTLKEIKIGKALIAKGPSHQLGCNGVYLETVNEQKDNTDNEAS